MTRAVWIAAFTLPGLLLLTSATAATGDAESRPVPDDGPAITPQQIEADWLRIIRFARERGCFMELNSQPVRLDLPDSWCHAAKDEGVLVAINSDAHSREDLDNLEWGIGQARRGWLGTDDVLNSRTLRRLRPLLRRTM